jgi:hypothetical protein
LTVKCAAFQTKGFEKHFSFFHFLNPSSKVQQSKQTQQRKKEKTKPSKKVKKRLHLFIYQVYVKERE